MIERLAYMKSGLAAISVFVGAKMLVRGWFEVPIWASLGAIGLMLSVAGAASARQRSRASLRS
jgi:tellurite resistance protein TerC